MGRLRLVAGVLAVVVAVPAVAAGKPVDASPNVRHVANFTFEGGTDIDFARKFVYAAKQGDNGGVHIFDISRARPKQVGFVPCPGTQNDVAVVKPGLIALGFYSGQCGGGGSGIRLIDVRDPKRPVFLDTVSFPEGTHTLTVFPGQPLIYSSPGGLGENGGTQSIIDVSNPRDAKVIHEFVPNPFGCHDVSFYVQGNRKLGFCPGQLETQVWDVSNPREPQVLAHIPPVMEFPHSAVASPDGDLLVIGDESLFTAHDCLTGRSPTGGLYAYDISDPSAPTFQGRISSPRGAAPVGTLATAICTAHNFNFVPGTRKVVTSWYTGGTSVIDFSTPSSPQEIAYFRPDDANTWSSYFYGGYVFANDGARGLDVLTIDGLPQPPPPQKPKPEEPKPEPEPEPEEPKPEEPKPDPEPCWTWTEDERYMATKVNEARTEHGRRRVELDPELSRVARHHSYEMIERRDVYHTPEKTLGRRVTRWRVLGENVGRGHSIDSLHKAFMNSQTHRDIILRPTFTYFGVGAIEQGGNVWITVLFEEVKNPGTTMSMPCEGRHQRR
ncbi:MAG: CAP domain-containing protein [Actinomycetota bacterium]